MCISNSPLCYKKKGTEIKIKSKVVTRIDPITGWSKITQYDDKKSTTTANLIETMWLTIYPTPMEISYDQGSEFIGHEFRKYLIETEYGINAKTRTLENPTSNAILERIHQVPGNLVRNFNIKET